MNHEDKPDYSLIKLWLAFSADDEEVAFRSKLNIKNEKLAKDILYENASLEKKAKEEEKKNDKLENIKKQVIEEEKKHVNDLDDDYQFDQDIDELGYYDNSIEYNYRKIDYNKVKRDKVREFILNHENRSAMRDQSKHRNASVSSNSRGDGLLNEVNSNASRNGSEHSAKGSIHGEEGGNGRSNSQRMGHGFPGGFSNVFKNMVKK